MTEWSQNEGQNFKFKMVNGSTVKVVEESPGVFVGYVDDFMVVITDSAEEASVSAEKAAK